MGPLSRNVRLAALALVGVATLGACTPTPGGGSPSTVPPSTAAPTTAAPTTAPPTTAPPTTAPPTTTPVDASIEGEYKVRYGADSTATMRRSGNTVTVTAGPGFKIEGASCTLPANTVLAILTGSGTTFTGSHWNFSSSTCTNSNSSSATAVVNGDATVSLTASSRTRLFTKVANAPAPTAGDLSAVYDVTYGTVGAVTAHIAGDNVTLSVASPIRIGGATCDLPRLTVLGVYSGTGQTRSGSHWNFSGSTCLTSNSSSSQIYVNSDRSLTVTSSSEPVVMIRRAATPTTSSPAIAGSYRTRHGSDGTVNVHQSGTTYTTSVLSSFSLEGATCSLAPTTVLATHTGTAPKLTGSRQNYSLSTCLQSNTSSSTMHVNSDRSLTLVGGGRAHLLERI